MKKHYHIALCESGVHLCDQLVLMAALSNGTAGVNFDILCMAAEVGVKNYAPNSGMKYEKPNDYTLQIFQTDKKGNEYLLLEIEQRISGVMKTFDDLHHELIN